LLYLEIGETCARIRPDQQIEDKAAEVVCFGDRLFTFQQTANICHLKEGGSGQFVTNYPNVHIDRIR